MTDAQQPDPQTDHDPRVGEPPGAPRWVMVLGVVFAILLLLLVVAMLVGRDHGPGRHVTNGARGGPLNHTVPDARTSEPKQTTGLVAW